MDFEGCIAEETLLAEILVFSLVGFQGSLDVASLQQGRFFFYALWRLRRRCGSVEYLFFLFKRRNQTQILGMGKRVFQSFRHA